MTRFTLRSLFLFMTLAAVCMGVWPTNKPNPDQLLADAKKALSAEGIAWSGRFDMYRQYTIDLDGRKLSMKAARAIVAAERIKQVNLLPVPNRNDIMTELLRGFPRSTLTGQDAFLHR